MAALKLHITWLIGTLVVVLIFVITAKFPDATRLEELITFAATLSSLLLAVIAILQSMIYAYAANRNKDTATFFNTRTMQILEQIPHLSKSVNDLSENVQRMQFARSPTTTGDQSLHMPEPKEFVPVLIATSSLGGLFTLLMCIKSFDRGKHIVIDDFEDKVLGWFSVGIVSGLASTNWMSYFIDGNKLIIKGINEHLRSSYEDIKRQFDEKSINNQPIRSEWARVESYIDLS